MKKSDKKIENALRVQLTEVCDQALDQFAGFEWLTHFVDYAEFPKSLYILCVFNREADIAELVNTGKEKQLFKLIEQRLAAENIRLKNIPKQVGFDSEERCSNDNAGKWPQRFDERYRGRRYIR